MAFIETCRALLILTQPAIRKVLAVALVGLVFIFSLFAGAVISSLFLHAVEF